MAGIVTTNFRKHNAEQFYEAFSEADESRMYFFIGRSTQWADDNNPPSPTDSIQATEYDIWSTMIAAKQISTSDVTYAISRNNWANNNFYSNYATSSTTLESNTFFVMTDDYRIYKCIGNAKSNSTVAAANSTVEPTGTSTSLLATADGYNWKYMYSISTADILKFLTTSYIPVSTDSTVAAAASNSSIDHIEVSANGSLYLGALGTMATVTNANTMTLASSAGTSDGMYNGSAVYITSGTGSGQVREILTYTGSTRSVKTLTNFDTQPDGTSTYSVGPLVTVKGSRGPKGSPSAASAYANVVYAANFAATGNTINKIGIVSSGAHYASANVTISANASHGSGATGTAMISPPGGHGANAVSELFGYNVMLNVQLTGTESGTHPIDQDFRVFGILKDPMEADGNAAEASVYDQTTRLTLTSVSGSGKWSKDELVTGDTSGSKARVVSFANTNGANTTGTLSVTNIDGASNGGFGTSETIRGATSSITSTVSAVANTGGLKPHSGKVIYVENRGPIQRSSDQTEDIKVVVKF